MENNHKKNSNVIAIVGFILSFFFSLIGLICSIIGLVKSKELHDGKAFSIAGIIISSLKLIFAIIIFGIFLLYIDYTYRVKEATQKINRSPVKELIEKDIIEDEKEIEDCVISRIDGFDIVLKDRKRIKEYYNTKVMSDLYINNKFAGNISLFDNPYNSCESLSIELVNNNYILIREANEGAMYTSAYLYSNEAKLITDFKDISNKYDKYSIVAIPEKGNLVIYYLADYGFETSLKDAYCEVKAEPNDYYKIIETIVIENDEMMIDETQKITWEEAYKCKDDNSSDCGNIYDIKCE